MATNDIPVSAVEEQILNVPTHSDSTIMDDTVMTMEGTALMGGPVTLIEGIQAKVEPNTPSAKIDIYR